MTYKKYSITLIHFAILITFLTTATIAQNIPPKPEPALFVTDLAKVLSVQEKESLEQKLSNYNDSTSTQIAIVFIDQLDGYDIEVYANKLARTWGIGQKGKDNGILLLASAKERKVRIELGYGIEPYISDLAAKKIIEHELVPAFKQETYAKGFEQATDTIIKALSGKFKPYRNEIFFGNTFRIVIYALTLLVIIFYPSLASKKHWLAFTLSVIFYTALIEPFLGYLIEFQWSWVLTGLGNLVILLFWNNQTDRESLKKYYLRRLQNLEKDTNWDELLKKYKGHKVTKLQAELTDALQHFSEESELKELRNKYRYLYDRISAPYRHDVGEREDHILQTLLHLAQRKVQDNEVYEESSRTAFMEKINRSAHEFDQLNLQGDFSREDLLKLIEVIDLFTPTVKAPYRYLKVNFPNFIKHIEQEFKTIKDKRPELISKNAQKALRKVKKLNFNFPENREQLFEFYEAQVISKLQKLNEKRTSSTYSYYSKPKKTSSYKRPSSSNYSYDYSSGSGGSSGTDFGGGDFGGGGASGDW